jgi:hypothetical protein
MNIFENNGSKTIYIEEEIKICDMFSTIQLKSLCFPVS